MNISVIYHAQNKQILGFTNLRDRAAICLGIFLVFLCVFNSKLAVAGLLDNCTPATPTECVTKNIPSKTWGGYTLITDVVKWGLGLPGDAILIDENGNKVHSWTVGAFSQMLPNGHLMAGFFYPGWLPGTQDVDCSVELDWDGNVVWPPGANLIDDPSGNRYCDPSAPIVTLNTDSLDRPVTRMHHDFQRKNNPGGYWAPGQDPILAGGETLIVANDNPPMENTAHISDFPIFNDKIYEVEFDQSTTINWQWDPIDHLEAGQGSPGDLGLGFSAIAREAIKTIKIQPNSPKHHDSTDWLHINSAAHLGNNQWCPDPHSVPCDLRFHPDNVIWDSRNANILAIVARHDHPEGNWKSGDIVWRLGPDYVIEEGKVDQLIGIHHTRMIPQGFQGAGNILVFDNGGAAGFGADPSGNPAYPIKFRNYSRVVEFDPVTLDVIWKYERPDPNPPEGENFAPFFSFFIGSAQRLINGNTFIDEGGRGRLFEVTRQGELVWEFVNPFGPFPPYYGDPTTGFTNYAYRAIRVPTQWLPPQARTNK